jgi:lipopolysaccharide/colanic/teichoic acid biosynthesis glycosyltransferase
MLKRIFDFILSLILLVILSPFFLVLVLAHILFKNIFFKQHRVGRFGKLFIIYKIKTMTNNNISSIGRVLRKYKIDELPQLWNILKGGMTFVGPRPDVPGYYDKLTGDDRRLLQLKPGLTSPAAIKYRNEEDLLAQQSNPKHYNDSVIFPDKVRMNLKYLEEKSFTYDISILVKTLLSFVKCIYLR